MKYSLTKAGFIKYDNHPWSQSLRLISIKSSSEKNQLKLTSDGNYDIKNKKLTNIHEGNESNDAVNFQQLSNIKNDLLNKINKIRSELNFQSKDLISYINRKNNTLNDNIKNIEEKLDINENSSNTRLQEMKDNFNSQITNLLTAFDDIVNNSNKNMKNYIEELHKVKELKITQTGLDDYEITEEFKAIRICGEIYYFTGEVRVDRDIEELSILVKFNNIDMGSTQRVPYYRYEKNTKINPKIEFALIEKDNKDPGMIYQLLIPYTGKIKKDERFIFQTMIIALDK